MYNVTNKWNGTIFDVSKQFTLYIALRHQKWYRFIYWWQALLNGYGHNPIVPDVLGSLIRIEKLNCNTRMDVSVRIQISTVLWHKRMKRKDLTLSLILKLAFKRICAGITEPLSKENMDSAFRNALLSVAHIKKVSTITFPFYLFTSSQNQENQNSGHDGDFTCVGGCLLSHEVQIYVWTLWMSKT